MASPAQAAEPARTGMATGTKLAIGAGAALSGCYKFGCFNRSASRPGNAVVGNDGQFR